MSANASESADAIELADDQVEAIQAGRAEFKTMPPSDDKPQAKEVVKVGFEQTFPTQIRLDP